MDYQILDVGCGNEKYAKGIVNVDFFRAGQNLQIGEQLKGEYVDPKKIPNFVVADACHLPFKDEAFDVVYSSHVIEHTSDSFKMFSEMHRVAKFKVIVRCPHIKGSGAKRPFHVSYFDEQWFKAAASKLGFHSRQFITAFDYPISSRINCPKKWQKSLPWRALRHIERRWLLNRCKIPFEVESWSNIIEDRRYHDKIRFVVVSNNQDILFNCFMKGKVEKPSIYINQDGVPLPDYFNLYCDSLDPKGNEWIVFCHQDFILRENLEPILNGLDVNSVYGVIGARVGFTILFGRILQIDDTTSGVFLPEPEPVQTLDEMCLIVHSSLFRKGLRFDPQFKFHFYGADLCLQAYTQGFGVYALQVDCQHKSRALAGETTSEEFKNTKKLFADKWAKFLPIRTTTGVVTV